MANVSHITLAYLSGTFIKLYSSRNELSSLEDQRSQKGRKKWRWGDYDEIPRAKENTEKKIKRKMEQEPSAWKRPGIAHRTRVLLPADDQGTRKNPGTESLAAVIQPFGVQEEQDAPRTPKRQQSTRQLDQEAWRVTARNCPRQLNDKRTTPESQRWRAVGRVKLDRVHINE